MTLGLVGLALMVAGPAGISTAAYGSPIPSPAPSAAYPTTLGSTTPTPTSAIPATRPAAPRALATSAELDVAVVTERAAQRSEQLAKEAEAIGRSAQQQSTSARELQLNAADRDRQAVAVQLATSNARLATAARLAAAGSAPGDPGTPAGPGPTPGPGPEVPSVPSGSGGVSPVPGAIIGAHFGQYGAWSSYHTGLDFRAAYGTPIRAVEPGVVLFAGNGGDWAGNHVAIQHADGLTTMSSHLSAMAVTTGQTVQAGQIIGYVGQTGRAFGAHLHFELYPVGVRYGDVYRAINPQPWLQSIGVNTR